MMLVVCFTSLEWTSTWKKGYQYKGHIEVEYCSEDDEEEESGGISLYWIFFGRSLRAQISKKQDHVYYTVQERHMNQPHPDGNHW